jgi:quercetin dioxygenase-like cupin family protein
MLSYVELQPHAVVAEHQHPHEQMGLILQGRALFVIDSQEKVLGPGDWYRVPGNVRHKVVALEDLVKVIDVFSPPREEYK